MPVLIIIEFHTMPYPAIIICCKHRKDKRIYFGTILGVLMLTQQAGVGMRAHYIYNIPFERVTIC